MSVQKIIFEERITKMWIRIHGPRQLAGFRIRSFYVWVLKRRRFGLKAEQKSWLEATPTNFNHPCNSFGLCYRIICGSGILPRYSSILSRAAIRHTFWRTVGTWSSGGGFKMGSGKLNIYNFPSFAGNFYGLSV